MQHDKNDEAEYIGKTHTGAPRRQSDAEHLSATLHGSAHAGVAPCKAARDPLPPDPQDN